MNEEAELTEIVRLLLVSLSSNATRQDKIATLEAYARIKAAGREAVIALIPQATAGLRAFINDPETPAVDRDAALDILKTHGIPLDPRMAH